MTSQEKKLSSNVSALELHEQICAIRYENLEKRLESGSARFVRMEYLIWGLYGVAITSGIFGALV